MRQILKRIKVVSAGTYIGEDNVGKWYTFHTDRLLRLNQSVLLVNGIVAGIVATTIPDVYEV